MSFRLIPKSVTLNGVMAIILRYFSELCKEDAMDRRKSRKLIKDIV